MKTKAKKTLRRDQPGPIYPSRPEFALTGIITGVVGGIAASLAIEIGIGRAEQIVMLISGLVGITLGFVVESIRFGWRYWRWKVAVSELNSKITKS